MNINKSLHLELNSSELWSSGDLFKKMLPPHAEERESPDWSLSSLHSFSVDFHVLVSGLKMHCHALALLTFTILITHVFVTALGELLEKFVLHLTENPSECYFPLVEYTGIF